MITLVLGGPQSGKSQHIKQLCAEEHPRKGYIRALNARRVSKDGMSFTFSELTGMPNDKLHRFVGSVVLRVPHPHDLYDFVSFMKLWSSSLGGTAFIEWDLYWAAHDKRFQQILDALRPDRIILCGSARTFNACSALKSFPLLASVMPLPPYTTKSRLSLHWVLEKHTGGLPRWEVLRVELVSYHENPKRRKVHAVIEDPVAAAAEAKAHKKKEDEPDTLS